MRVLIDCHCFDGEAAEGINTYIKGVYTHLIPLMPETRFYFAALNSDRLRAIFGNASNIRYITLKSRSRISRMLEYRRLVRRHGIDIAHFQYIAPPGIGCRLLITTHDLIFKDFPTRFPLAYRLPRDIFFRLSSRRADLLATVSEYSRGRIASHYGIPAENILLTRNGVDESFFNVPLDRAKGFTEAKGVRPYILNVSRIEPRKNQLTLLQAYHELGLAAKGYDLVLINQPSIPVREFEDYYNSLPPDEKVHVHRMGTVDQEELKLWYRAATLFVFPSIAEGFGIPPIEAAATGVPVICHNATAMADFTFFGNNHIDAESLENLKSAILRNLSNPAPASELEKIKGCIRDNYSWDSAAEVLCFAFSGIFS